MYGVTANFPMHGFLGGTVTQLCIGPHDVQLHFSDCEQKFISIWGEWRLISKERTVSGIADTRGLNDALLLDLVEATVDMAEAVPPDRIRLRFTDGVTLEVIDSSKRYESFQIGDLVV